MRQGDTLSLTLFCIFIKDLAVELNKLNLGIKIGHTCISILLYADDIALLAENEENLRQMLCFVDQWCKKWKVSINSSKTKIVHFRKSRKKLTDRDFHEHHINVVNAYKLSSRGWLVFL